jgi:GNAT superfamily N-acetyltransferase
MSKPQLSDIHFVEADEQWRPRIAREWGEWALRELHIHDGFTLVALHRDRPVGLISVYWRTLPAPLPPTREGYIDIIDVAAEYRRRGIARTLVDMSLERAKAAGAYQLRAWSTHDKREAIPMWKALGFGLCPTTHAMWGEEVTGYFVVRIVS